MILAMNAWDHGEAELSEEDEDEIDELVPSLIPAFVRHLNAWTKSRATAKSEGEGIDQRVRIDPDPAVSRRKVGRNEPCPCGSGRKYKRCCGAT